MSDNFFDRLESYRQQTPSHLDNPDRNQEFFLRAGDQFQRKREEEAKIYSALNLNINTDAYKYLKGQVDNGSMDEEELFRLAASMNIADRYGLPIDYVRGNLPVFLTSEGVNPETKPTLTLLRSILNRGQIGLSTPKIGNMKYEFMNANGPDGDTDHAKWLQTEIKRLEEVNRQLEDAIPNETRTTREKVTQTFKNLFGSGVQTLGYSGYIFLHNLLGQVAGLGVMNFGPLFAWDAGRKIEAGDEYWALTEMGIDHDIAYPLSQAHGAISAGIEQVLEYALGLGVGGLLRLISGKPMSAVMGRLSSAVFRGLQHNGFLFNAGTALMGWTLNIPSEFGEEFLQEGDSILFENIAITLQNTRWEGMIAEIQDGRSVLELSDEELETIKTIRILQENISKKSFGEALTQMFKAGIEGATAAIVLGLPGAALQTGIAAIDVRRARNMAESIPSREAYRKATEELSIFKNLSPEDRKVAQDKVWDNLSRKRDSIITKEAEAIKPGSGLGEGYAAQEVNPETNEEIPLGSPYLKKDDTYYSELDDKRSIYKVGDPRVETGRNLYADIQYHRESDNTIIIDKFNARRDLDTDEFRSKVWGQFSETFAGNDIKWEPNTEREVNIRDALIKNNPIGEQAGLNYYTTQDTENITGARYRNRVIDTFKQYFPGENSAVHDVMAAEWEAIAGLESLSLEDYVNREFGSLDKVFTTQANTDVYAASKKGKNVIGAVSFEGLARDARAMIYVTKNSDLSTFIHEMGHIYRRRLSGDLLAEAERIWKVADGKWTEAQEEQYTQDLERWRRDGKAPTPQMQSFFEKFAAFLKKIYNAVSRRGSVSPEVKGFFDKLYRGEQAQSAAKNNTAGIQTAQTGLMGEVVGNQVRGTTGYDDIETWVGTLPKENQRLYRENKALNESRRNLDQKNTNLKIEGVGENDLEALKAKAREGHDFIRDLANTWARQWDDRALGRPGFEENAILKNDDRAKEKHTEEATPYNAMFDMVGFTVVVSDFKTLVGMAESVATNEAVVRIKDRYKTTPKSGYQDILLNIKAPNGFIGEIQLNVSQMYDAKEKYGGHAIYEVQRELSKEVKKGNIDDRTGEQDDYLLKEISAKYYGKATGLLFAEAQASASSLDMGDPSFWVYTSKNSVGDNVLSAFTLNKFRPLLAQAILRHSTNQSLGSSIDGTSIAGEAEEAGAAAESNNVSLTTVPSINNIQGNQDSFNDIREKYQTAVKEYGDTDTININGTEMEGRWVLTEAETPTASHDERTFNETKGFPTVDGRSINDRDYRNDKQAQEAVIRIAANYDSRALEGVVVSTDGIVISGNNRTMSSKLAARQNTDNKYRTALEQKVKRYGISAEQVRHFTHPRLLFEVDAKDNYDTALFAQFNQSTKKAMDPVETAVKMAKLIKDPTVISIAAVIDAHESIEDLYKDKKALQEIFNTVRNDGLIGEYDMPQFFIADTGITGAGEELLENVLLGAVLQEKNIRALNNSKAIRRKLIQALPKLIENRAMGEYSIMPEVNEAARIALEVDQNQKTFKNVQDWASQQGFDFMGQKNQVAIELASVLEQGKQQEFGDFIGGLNSVLEAASRGQADMFAGTVESKEDIVRRYLGIKARIDEVKTANDKIIRSKTASQHDKAQAALGNAGIARNEADGTLMQTLFQAAYHWSPYRFDSFNSNQIGTGEGVQAYGWGHYFASKKEIAEYYYENLSNTTVELSSLTNPESERRILSLLKDSGLLNKIIQWKEGKQQNGNVNILDVANYITETGIKANIDGLFKTIAALIGSNEQAKNLFEKTIWNTNLVSFMKLIFLMMYICLTGIRHSPNNQHK
ncbi:MAG: hypothetical protein FWD78_02900 [Treponema sp.]|nr:hypothetical protein [Treponema sp.]